MFWPSHLCLHVLQDSSCLGPRSNRLLTAPFLFIHMWFNEKKKFYLLFQLTSFGKTQRREFQYTHTVDYWNIMFLELTWDHQEQRWKSSVVQPCWRISNHGAAFNPQKFYELFHQPKDKRSQPTKKPKYYKKHCFPNKLTLSIISWSNPSTCVLFYTQIWRIKIFDFRWTNLWNH